MNYLTKSKSLLFFSLIIQFLWIDFVQAGNNRPGGRRNSGASISSNSSSHRTTVSNNRNNRSNNRNNRSDNRNNKTMNKTMMNRNNQVGRGGSVAAGAAIANNQNQQQTQQAIALWVAHCNNNPSDERCKNTDSTNTSNPQTQVTVTT